MILSALANLSTDSKTTARRRIASVYRGSAFERAGKDAQALVVLLTIEKWNPGFEDGPSDMLGPENTLLGLSTVARIYRRQGRLQDAQKA